MSDIHEASVCVDLDVDQLAELERHYDLRFDDPAVPSSAGSGPGEYTVVIHPAEADDDCGDCRQRIDVLCEDEELLDRAVAEVEAFIASIGGRVCE